MKTIRRLVYGEVLRSITLVAVGFLALFLFFDLVDELQHLGKSKKRAKNPTATSVMERKTSP